MEKVQLLQVFTLKEKSCRRRQHGWGFPKHSPVLSASGRYFQEHKQTLGFQPLWYHTSRVPWKSPPSVLNLDFCLFSEALNLVSDVTALFFFYKGNPLICGFKVISEGIGALLVYKAVSAVAFIRWVIGGGPWPTSIVCSRQGSDMSSNINELCQEGDIELRKLILSFGLPLPRLLPIPSRFFRPKSQILNWD